MIEQRIVAEQRFDAEMLDVYRQAKRQAGYNAVRFLQMLGEYGGVETAHRLLRPPVAAVSDGFTELHLRGYPNLTVEALVLRFEFTTLLFSDEERDIARQRLAQIAYKPQEKEPSAVTNGQV